MCPYDKAGLGGVANDRPERAALAMTCETLVGMDDHHHVVRFAIGPERGDEGILQPNAQAVEFDPFDEHLLANCTEIRDSGSVEMQPRLQIAHQLSVERTGTHGRWGGYAIDAIEDVPQIEGHMDLGR